MAPQLHACVAPQLHACVAPQLQVHVHGVQHAGYFLCLRNVQLNCNFNFLSPRPSLHHHFSIIISIIKPAHQRSGRSAASAAHVACTKDVDTQSLTTRIRFAKNR